MKTNKIVLATLLTFGLSQGIVADISNAKNTNFPKSFTPAIIAGGALYIGYNYLVREDMLVENTHPHAFAWFKEIQKKYNNKELNQVVFLQKPKKSPIYDYLESSVKACNWSNSYKNRIFFSKDSLKEINFIYKNILLGNIVEDKDLLTLARYEYVLLYEAGYAQNHFMQDLLGSILALSAATITIDNISKKYNNSQTLIGTEDALKNITKNGIQLPKANDETKFALGLLGLPSELPATIATPMGAGILGAIGATLQYEAAKADAFALKHADTKTLKAALKLFKNSDADPLYDIENVTLKPFVPVEGLFGNAIQNIAGSAEAFVGFLVQQCLILIKTVPATRYAYGLIQDATHQPAYVRALQIEEEIVERENK
ncbi:MAG: hypothetical protein ACXWL5_02430 [Candidatus Chromulinivorax sp.]